MNRRRVLSAVVICAVFYGALATADSFEIPPGARVGLVLSGGGARGLAHVGVIRVLESQGIRPAIITGTSMGSIIGALYATGRSADEIERLARGMDWRQALSDASPRRYQPYTFRELEAGMTADFRMSITRAGIAFPRGVIEGQHLEQLLDQMFEERGEPLQFSQLPLRFAAVAADLETGEQVVIDRGDVASAVRASMSVPGAIAPVERDGRLLVDGGIANNMPVDVARAMGADFIIAVDVSAPLRKRDELNSVFTVANQTMGFLVRLNTVRQRENMRQGDVLIVPDLQGYSSTAFDQADGIIRAGIDAAVAALGVTGDVSVEGGATEPDRARHEPVIGFIRVVNNSPVSDNVVRSLIRQPLGQPLDRVLIENDITRLYGLDYFSLVRYRIVERDGAKGIEVRCVARESGNNWLKLGLELQDDFRGNSQFGLSASLRSAGLNRYGGTAFTRIQLGTTPEVELRFLQPLDPGLRYFIEPAAGYAADAFDLYVDDLQEQPLSRYRKSDRWIALSVGRLLWREVAEIRLGAVREYGTLDFLSGLDVVNQGSDQSYQDGFYFVRIGWDSLDDLGFPSEGARWSVTREAHDSGLGADEDFGRVLTDFTLAVTSGRNTYLLEGDTAISDSDEADFVDIPFIGGFLELSGLPPRSRFGRHRALLRGILYRRLDQDGPLPLGVPVYLGLSLERGNVWLDRDNISWSDAIGAGSVFIGARTPLGPAYLSYGATEEGDRSLSIFLGQRFR
ncbi:MAG: patatin-like phospholipase family protein [Gammaproteobacteria bacterium]|nr:patatin-like phospholipase family protein [Gammaproteobacteria bacterium]